MKIFCCLQTYIIIINSKICSSKSVYSQMKFKEYVKSLRNLLQKGQCKRFVMGNSGADYDSVVGAIVYAYYLTTVEDRLYLPLVDCPEADIELRFEQVKVFQALNLSQHELLFTSMVPNLYTSDYHFALNDHNSRPLIKPQFLHEVIDHHAYDPETMKCNHIINHCGSALTLIYYLYYPELLEKFKGKELYDKFMKYFTYHKGSHKFQEGEHQELINHLIYYGITIDTYGVNPNQGHVWNEFDEYAIQTLQTKIKPLFKFEDLGEAKYNIDRNLKLSFRQQQKKDYKYLKYETFFAHYSTILIDIDIFIKRYWKQLTQELPRQSMKVNEAHIFMFAFPRGEQDIVTGNFRRFILFNAKEDRLLLKIDKILHQMGFNKLEEIDGWKKWVDVSGRISRKILDKQIRAKQEEQQEVNIDFLKGL